MECVWKTHYQKGRLMRPYIMFFLAAVSHAAVPPHEVPLVSIAPEGKETVLSAGTDIIFNPADGMEYVLDIVLIA